MSQHTLNTDVNAALAALGSTMKGPGVPPAPLAGMLWLDDSAAPWSLRIYDGSDWIPVGTVDPSTNVFVADGLAAGRFFAPRANNTPDMKLRLNAGIVFDPVTQTLTGVVSQETAALTAPSTNPRKDIVYIDRETGILGVATGTEAASPVDPAIPAGKLPVARINWTAGATAIVNPMIDDIRVLNALGLGALAVQDFIVDVPQSIAFSGDITPSTITADQNDYNPSGLSAASTLRLASNASRNITGLAGGADGRIVIVHNVGANPIVLLNENASSSAANRFALDADVTLTANQATALQYDSTSSRWRAVARPAGIVSDVPQNFSLSGFLTPPTITASQNNYDPTGLATVSTLRLTANAAHNITGLAGGTPGRILIVHNIGASNITLKKENASSSATNRFALNGDIGLAFNQAAILQYDPTSERWRAIAYQPTGTAPGGLSRSLRFNSADSAYLNRTPGSTGDRKTWTWSGWVKTAGFGVWRTLFGAGTSGSDAFLFAMNTVDQLVIQNIVSSSATLDKRTGAVFRDPSAWQHIVCSLDTNAGAPADRAKLYVNGRQITSFSTDTNPSASADTHVNSTVAHYVGRGATVTGDYWSGYMTAVHFVDGQALGPDAFGEFDENGTWMPKEYGGTYGNNGFWLDFGDNSGTTSATLGKDRSGNNNDWTPNGFSVAAGPGNDSLIDLPVNFDDGGNGRGNYAVWSPTTPKRSGAASSPTFANGNLDIGFPTNADTYLSPATIGVKSGKWYWEVTPTAGSAASYEVGVLSSDKFSQSFTGGGTAIVEGQGYKYDWNGTQGADAGVAYTTNDTLILALDVDSGKLWVGKNGTWFNGGNPAGNANPLFTGISGQVFPGVGTGASAFSFSYTGNFGQRPFAYPAPEGFKALNTQNLPAPAIAKPASYMNPVLYTGNGSTKTVSGVGFQPNLVWLKSRSNTLDHKLTDAIRGTTKGLESNTADAESTDTNGLTAFNSDGFALGSDATYNTNSATYVAWNWKTGVTPGFDILSYTGDGNSGRTVSHGLGVAPSLVIVKNRTDGSTDWAVWHSALANTEALNLNAVGPVFTATSYWNSTTPSSSGLTLGNSALVNGSGKSYVAYLWAEVPGFSRFGSYTGNGNADGPFVWCGFRPQYVLIRSTSNNRNYWITDADSSPTNGTVSYLFANSNQAASTNSTFPVDFLANGIKVRNTTFDNNNSGDTYLVAAFAEAPFKTARAR